MKNATLSFSTFHFKKKTFSKVSNYLVCMLTLLLFGISCYFGVMYTLLARAEGHYVWLWIEILIALL